MLNRIKHKLALTVLLPLVALLAFAGGAAAQVALQPVQLLDMMSFGTTLGYFRKVPQPRYLNFLDGAFYNTSTRALEIGGLLDVGPTTLPTAVASATTIAAPTTGNTFHVTGTTAIATITSPFGARTGCINIVPDGIFTTTTAGNIALASTAVVNKVLTECYDSTTTKWYPSY